MMPGFRSAEWVERRKPGTRIGLLLLAIVLALFVGGMITGFIVASVEQGHFLPRKPMGWIVLIGALLAGYGLYRAIRLLLRPSLSEGLSPFEQRYSKMWLWVVLLGVPIGIGLAMFSLDSEPGGSYFGIFSDGVLPPYGAALLSIALLILFGVAAILYHRTIDDHEERAYLWGSQIAYYFLAASIPIYWLLFRGGLVPALTAGGAMLLLLASFVVQAAIWAWFKFR